MNKSQLNKLIDLIEDIKKLDSMINIHRELDDSDFEVNQYQAKKDKLMSYLIDELVSPKVRSPRSYYTIKLILDKFYPGMKKEKDADKEDFEDLNALESALN